MDTILSELFLQWAGEPCLEQLALGANGSNRRYYRLIGNTRRCIATIGDEQRENDTFLYYSEHFRRKHLPVPEIYAVSPDRRCYLQEDLGDMTLYAYLYDKKRQGGGFDAEVLSLYKQVLSDLVRFQTECRDLDFSQAYPRSDFDRQSIQWDLNYFKYYFLKLAYIPFDEQLLENDFDRFIDYLLDEDCTYFMYRDFQSRNIMIDPSGRLCYIDYQGGRRGAAQYDVASLLYSAKSDFPEPIRQELLHHYVQEFVAATHVDAASFSEKFYAYVLVRIMQAMGAYGYRGYFERKDYFLKSIPLAINNLRLVVENHPLPIALPHLTQVWNAIVAKGSSVAEAFGVVANAASAFEKLTVEVCSFSFKKGYPADLSGNGGGFVFDCRALPNPGRYPEYRNYTGKDKPVIDFLKDEPAVGVFLDNAFALVAQSVEKYIERHFTHLMVSFGCTGGQHRSVYCAERMAQYLRERFDCHVVVKHVEQG